MKLSKFKPIQSSIKGVKRFAGRNQQGRITVRHQGGGHKQLYRQINWNRKSLDEGIVVNFEYDPNRSSYLAKICHIEKESKSSDNNIKSQKEKKSFSYILAPKGLKVFDYVRTIKEKSKDLQLRPGDYSMLSNFEYGDLIHGVESFASTGATFARSAGTYCQVLEQISSKYVKVRLPSGSLRLISGEACATLGLVGREHYNKINLKKAGKSRWLNKRPSVRGVAMNPVDHPHGGGQGKTKGGRPSVTPSSKPTKGQPTRNRRKKNTLIITLR